MVCLFEKTLSCIELLHGINMERLGARHPLPILLFLLLHRFLCFLSLVRDTTDGNDQLVYLLLTQVFLAFPRNRMFQHFLSKALLVIVRDFLHIGEIVYAILYHEVRHFYHALVLVISKHSLEGDVFLLQVG